MDQQVFISRNTPLFVQLQLAGCLLAPEDSDGVTILLPIPSHQTYFHSTRSPRIVF